MADKTEKPSISIKLSTHAEAAGNEGNTENAAEQQTLDVRDMRLNFYCVCSSVVL